MAQTAVFQTYGDLTIKTDIVLDSVEIISAREDGIFAMLGKTNAIAMIHSYPVDTLLTPASQAVEQGQDFTYTTRTSPTLLTNLVEEIAIPIRVTRPQIAVQHYHGQNELDRQLAKGLMEFTNAVEFDLVRGTQASGISGTAQTMAKPFALFRTLCYNLMYGLQAMWYKDSDKKKEFILQPQMLCGLAI